MGAPHSIPVSPRDNSWNSTYICIGKTYTCVAGQFTDSDIVGIGVSPYEICSILDTDSYLDTGCIFTAYFCPDHSGRRWLSFQLTPRCPIDLA
jgi:hypothetical protein